MLQRLNVKMKKGFTLLEVVVAIFIVTIGVGGAIAAIQKATAFTSVSTSRAVAAYLLQEGIEIVRNIRDTNWLEGADWDNGIPAGDWEVDYKTQDLIQPYAGNYLNIDTKGFYSYSAGEATKFKRRIHIFKEIDIIEVFVQVEWSERGRVHSLSGQENLYNWF